MTPIALTSTVQDVRNFLVEDSTRIAVEIAVSGAALSAFEIHANVCANGTYQKLYSSATDYTSPQGLLLGCGRSDSSTNSDLTTIPAGAFGYFQMDIAAFHSIKIRAAGNGATIALNIGSQ